VALITAANVLEHFRQLTGTAENATLTTQIDRFDALAAMFCGWPVPDNGTPTMTAQTYTRYYDGPSLDQASRLDLGHPVIASYTSAAVDSAGDWSYATAIPSSDLVLDTVGMALWLKPTSSNAWYTSPRSNKVVFTGGFSATPPNLIAAAALGVRHLLTLRGTPLGERATTQGGTSVSRDDMDALLPHAVRDALVPYIHWGSRLG
jgi:hypothetical protein